MTATRCRLPDRRRHHTDTVRIGGQTLHYSLGRYPDGKLGEVFIDLQRSGSAIRAWSGAFALLMSLMIQYAIPLDEIADALDGINSEAFGLVPVTGHPNIKECGGVLDFFARVLRLENKPAVSSATKVVNLTEGSGF